MTYKHDASEGIGIEIGYPPCSALTIEMREWCTTWCIEAGRAKLVHCGGVSRLGEGKLVNCCGVLTVRRGEVGALLWCNNGLGGKGVVDCCGVLEQEGCASMWCFDSCGLIVGLRSSALLESEKAYTTSMVYHQALTWVNMVYHIYEVCGASNRPVYGPGRWWCIRSKCVLAPEVAVTMVVH